MIYFLCAGALISSISFSDGPGLEGGYLAVGLENGNIEIMEQRGEGFTSFLTLDPYPIQAQTEVQCIAVLISCLFFFVGCFCCFNFCLLLLFSCFQKFI